MSESKRKPLFERLKKGLKEGISHTRGQRALKTADVPEEPPEIDGLTLAALREEAAMTQSLFAKVLNVSSKTVQSWEQGVREPSMSSRRMIHIFSQRPDVVCEIVGLPGITLKGVTIVSIGQGRRKIVLERPCSIRKEKEKNS